MKRGLILGALQKPDLHGDVLMDDVLSDLVDFGNAITECGVADSSAGLHAFLMASIPRNRLPLVFWPIVVGALQAICLSDN